MSQEVKRLVEALGLEKNKVIKFPSGGSNLAHKFDVSPQDFLQLAEDDYEKGGNAALLNAITNAKRAIHCQMDQALMCLGFNSSRWNLPKKVELLVELGFVTPRILQKVSDARNVLEHQYVAPSLDQVSEALDLAALFVEATNRHLDIFEDQFSLGHSDEQGENYDCLNELSFSFDDTQNKYFRVRAIRNNETKNWRQSYSEVGSVIIGPQDEIYKPIIRIVVAGDNEMKVKGAIERFFSTLSKY